MPEAATETEQVYLSGRDKDHTADWDFMCTTNAKSGERATPPVPSNWDAHGFGILNYKKDIETDLAERGLFRHHFSIPVEWAEKQVLIIFEGSMTGTTVRKISQIAESTHQGGFYRFKYEITSLIKPSEQNLLETDVAKHSANESMNNRVTDPNRRW